MFIRYVFKILLFYGIINAALAKSLSDVDLEVVPEHDYYMTEHFIQDVPLTTEELAALYDCVYNFIKCDVTVEQIGKNGNAKFIKKLSDDEKKILIGYAVSKSNVSAKRVELGGDRFTPEHQLSDTFKITFNNDSKKKFIWALQYFNSGYCKLSVGDFDSKEDGIPIVSVRISLRCIFPNSTFAPGSNGERYISTLLKYDNIFFSFISGTENEKEDNVLKPEKILKLVNLITDESSSKIISAFGSYKNFIYTDLSDDQRKALYACLLKLSTRAHPSLIATLDGVEEQEFFIGKKLLGSFYYKYNQYPSVTFRKEPKGILSEIFEPRNNKNKIIFYSPDLYNLFYSIQAKAKFQNAFE